MGTNLDSQTLLRLEKFAAPIKCPGCNQLGSATWEANAEFSLKSPQAVLVSVSSGFYQRICRPHTGGTEIVCGVCDSVLYD
jgi:hypothetical protein